MRAAQNELIKRFPCPAAFQQRIARVGLTAEQFYEIVRQRVEIERYLDFRFRSFVIVTQKEIADYYRDIYVPRFRRQSPGRVVPTLEEATKVIEQRSPRDKIESDTDAFLEDARARAEIVILNPCDPRTPQPTPLSSCVVAAVTVAGSSSFAARAGRHARMKKLRILITCEMLDGRGGTELYVRDVALSLLRLGHTPVVFTSRPGEVAAEIRDLTVPVVDRLDALAVTPDLIYGQHHLPTMMALLHFADVPAVYVCHDWYWQNAFAPRFPRILRFVAVDVACRDRLVCEDGIDESRVRLLPNSVDLDRFERRPAAPRAAPPRAGLRQLHSGEPASGGAARGVREARHTARRDRGDDEQRRRQAGGSPQALRHRLRQRARRARSTRGRRGGHRLFGDSFSWPAGQGGRGRAAAPSEFRNPRHGRRARAGRAGGARRGRACPVRSRSTPPRPPRWSRARAGQAAAMHAVEEMCEEVVAEYEQTQGGIRSAARGAGGGRLHGTSGDAVRSVREAQQTEHARTRPSRRLNRRLDRFPRLAGILRPLARALMR